MDYAKAVKKLREKLIMTQSEFAVLLNVSAITISRWESGVFEPTIKAKRKLAKLFTDNNIEVEQK